MCERTEVNNWQPQSSSPVFLYLGICNNFARYAYCTCRELECVLSRTTYVSPPAGFASHLNPVILCKVSIIGPLPLPKNQCGCAMGAMRLDPAPLQPRRALGFCCCSSAIRSPSFHCALCIYLTAGRGVIPSSFEHDYNVQNLLVN